MPRRKVSNLLALAVLSYLSQRAMHPYELSKTLKDNNDDRSIKYNQGSLYMVVQQLARAGFIEARGTSRDGQRPERTSYGLTDAGRQELHDWLRELIEQPTHEYPSFVAALSLIAALPPDEAVELLARRRDRLRRQGDEARAAIEEANEAGVHPLFLIEEEYRIALVDTEIAFVTSLTTRITDPGDGWAPEWASFHAPRPATDGEANS